MNQNLKGGKRIDIIACQDKRMQEGTPPLTSCNYTS